MNLKRLRSIFFLALLLSFLNSARAEEIKIDAILKSAILNETRGNQHHSFNTRAKSKLCNSGGVIQRALCAASIVNGTAEITFKNYQFTDRGVDYSHIRPAPVPEEVEYSYYGIKNCTSLDKEINEKVTVVSTDRNSI